MQMKCAIQEAWHAMFNILYGFVVSYVPVVPYGGKFEANCVY
jgi:hypothetical protein